MKIFSSLFCSVCFLSTVWAKKGFILTCPKALTAGSTEYFSFTAFELPHDHPKALLVQLQDWYTGEFISSATVRLHHNMNVWVEMQIPPSSTDTVAKLSVHGSLGDGHRVDAAKKVRIRRSSVITFVQTDKPVYKPGQTVRFRILPLNRQLTPLDPDTAIGDVWIEDPSGIRIAQWKQLNFTTGIVQLELPLSSEPPLGQWTIHTTVNQVAHSRKFSVDKYVLPEFEVTISPPAYVMRGAEYIPVKICAWYSYGKKVEGTLHTKVTYERRENEEVPSVEHSGPISSCETIQINARDIQMHTSKFGRRTLEFFAEVSENSTGLTFNATVHRELTVSPLKLEFSASKYFKPGIPFYGELIAYTPDNKLVPNEKIQICATYRTKLPSHRRTRMIYRRRPGHYPPTTVPLQTHCKNFTTNKEGRVTFSVPPMSDRCIHITIEATAVGYERISYPGEDYFIKQDRPTEKFYLQPWHSISGHHVQVASSGGSLECGRQHRVRVRYTALNGTDLHFYHQVVSRGRIVQQGSHRRTHHPSSTMDRGPFDLGPADPATSPDLTPGDFSVVVRADAAASPAARLLVFHVLPSGEVVADSRKIRVAPCLHNKVNLNFRHEQQYPDTDASLLLSAAPGSLCGVGMVDNSVTFLKYKEHFNKEKIFDVLEKLDVGREAEPQQVSKDHCLKDEESESYFFPRKVSDHVDAAMAFDEAGTVVISDLELETRPCRESDEFQPYLMAFDYNIGPPGLPGLDGPSHLLSHRKVSPTTEAPPSPPPPGSKEEETEVRSYFPETWLWEMHALGPSGEAALVRRLPHTITTWIGGAVCVHPEVGLGVAEGTSIAALRPFFLSLRLPLTVTRGEQVPVTVAVFNYLEECLNIHVVLDPSADFEVKSEDHTSTLCVCGSESRATSFTIRPTAVGPTNITVRGYSVEGDGACSGSGALASRDAISKQMVVEAEGLPKEDVFNYFVCPETTNGSYAEEVDLLLPEDVVEGSERAYVSVTGDLLGPSLGHLDGLVHMPAGCGEQNMALLVPNILVLEYLRATSKPDKRLQSQCLEHIKTGYQRQLQYRHSDGSFSAFGSRDSSGSTWLTAFVVRSLGQARKHVSIDEQDLARSAAWLLDRQLENGCFGASGFVYNKALKGGLSGGAESPAPLTAYVLLSLLESGAMQPSASSSALLCLKREPVPSPYALALFAYAAALAKEPDDANMYLRRLEATATTNAGSFEKYWDIKEGGLSVAVETAAYYVLTRVELEGRYSGSKVLPVIRWMLRHRNARGGFVSTQDTAVALQALARHSALHQSSQVDLGLAIEGEGIVKGFRVDQGNRLLTQGAEVPSLPTAIDMQAVGEGCALVQYILRYNVDRSSTSNAFKLDVVAEIEHQNEMSCYRPKIRICMRYKISMQVSNMAVMSLKMATGFVPDKQTLEKLQAEDEVQLMRYEVKDNGLNLYFNEVTNEEKCFTFFVFREVVVLDLKPASVHLYDYYHPEYEVTKEYTIPTACTDTSGLMHETTDSEGLTDNPSTEGMHQETTISEDSPMQGSEENTATDIPTSQVLTSTIQTQFVTEDTSQTDGITEVLEDGTQDVRTTSGTPAVESEPEIKTEAPEEISEVDQQGLASPTEETGKDKTGTAYSIEPNPEDVDHTALTEDKNGEAVSDGEPAKLEPAVIDYDSLQPAIALAAVADSILLEDLDQVNNLNVDGDHLINFVDRDEDPDFPDGIEGNFPVTVLPADGDIENALEDNGEQSDS